MTSEPNAPRTLLLVAALVGTGLAGCIGDDPLQANSLIEADQDFDGTWTWVAPWAQDASGNATEAHALLVEQARTPRYVESLVPGDGGEPNIGITSSGAVFVTSGEDTYRSTDHGLTWEIVHQLISPNHPVTEDYYQTADPMLWVDPLTDRVYVSHMSPALFCTYMAWSDDDGASWFERPGSCLLPYLDHQKVMTAPHGPASPFAAVPGPYPNVVYICVNKLELGTTCAVSQDGGLTYAYEQQVIEQDLFCGNINGHPAAFPDGTVAIPLGGFDAGEGCQRPLKVYVTEDDGLSWQERVCAPERFQVEIDPDITVTPDGTAYLLFRDKDQRVHLLRSTDKFQTCDVFDVAPADQAMQVFTVITSGSDGRIALAYLGTRDEQRRGATPSNATAGTVWHLFVSTSIDADADEPTFTTVQVTPEEDPVQIGCIWLRGGGGGAQGCRNLLDFMDLHRDAEGRAYVAFTDGCTPRTGCTGTPEDVGLQSRDRQVSVAVQVGGESLLAEVGVLDPLQLERPQPDPSVEPADGSDPIARTLAGCARGASCPTTSWKPTS